LYVLNAVKIITRTKTPDTELAPASLVREGYPHQAGSAPSMPPDELAPTELSGQYSVCFRL